MLKRSHRRFYLSKDKSPTFANLGFYLSEYGWQNTSFPYRADFGEQHFNFNQEVCECLEFKHFLAQFLAHNGLAFAPLTFGINDSNWTSILSCLPQIAKPWILKPALLNNGQSIHIFKNQEAIENHFISPHRMGGEQVLQLYINNPHLIRERKYSIRMFVVLTNYQGAFIYPEGYFNIALQPYHQNMQDLSAHLTNEHLQGYEPNVIQIPTKEFSFFSAMYPHIKHICQQLTAKLFITFPQAFSAQRKKTIEVFGFDFLMDATQRLWLLEINQRPCFPIEKEHPLQKFLYEDFWRSFIIQFVYPMANINAQHLQAPQIFENLGVIFQDLNLHQ